MDRGLYLPQGWAEDGGRRREAGAPEGARFQTKPQLAQIQYRSVGRLQADVALKRPVAPLSRPV